MSNEKNPFGEVLFQAETDPDIRSLLVDIFGEIGHGKERKDVACFSADASSFGLLIWLAAPILYRWAIDTLNSRRERLELDAAR